MGFPAIINVGGELYAVTVPKLWNTVTLQYETETVQMLGGVGGGGGDASAANQVLELAKLTSLDTKLPADPAREGGNLATILARLDVALSTRLKPADTLAAITSLTQLNGQAISMGTGVRDGGTQRITIATNDLLPISDNGGSITIDAIDGAIASIGALADAEVAGAGAASVIAVLKRLRTLLNGGLPAALVGGRLDVNLGALTAGLLFDVSDRDARLAGRVKNLDSTGAVIDPALKGQLPAALVGGRLDINIGAQGVTPLKAREDAVAMVWASLKSAAPAIGAVQADTGALAAGDYDFDIYGVVSDIVAVGKGLVVEHRNAANGATLQTLGGVSTQGELQMSLRRYTMALNERLRIIAGTAAGAAASMYVSAIGRRVA